MNLIEALKGHQKGILPIKLGTIYKWHSMKKYPKLIVKVGGKLFFDRDEWERMAEQAIKNQVKESERIRSFLNNRRS